jgi:aminoglycoside phosphotransferase (APT) family kinase protein
VTPDDAARAVRPFFPGPADPAVARLGEGDYCHAFAVAGDWAFLFPKTGEASASLERLARLTPRLGPALPVAIPVVEHSRRLGETGRLFVGYRRVAGSALDPGAGAAALERAARGLATVVQRLHAFDVDVAAAAGVPVCEYPFAANEDGIRAAAADVEYRADLARLAGHDVVAPPMVSALAQALAGHLDGARAAPTGVLLHGELSCEHVLVDDGGELTGVVDLNGMIVGDPARDLLYLYEELGQPFVELVLAAGASAEPPEDVLERLRFLRLWHAALRVLWLLEHGYARRVASRLSELEALLAA